MFVLSTRFSQEAQPNVLYEAMASGAAIVSTRWAGVPWIVESSVARLIEPGGDRGRDLAEAVTDILADGDFDTVRTRQSEAFRCKKADADKRFYLLLDALAPDH